MRIEETILRNLIYNEEYTRKVLPFLDNKYFHDFSEKVLFEEEKGNKFMIKQIAGWIARRIINYMEPENRVQRGDRLGFIRFGSRVDIIVPEDFQINVNVGDMVQGNKTIIGRFQ